MTFNTALSGLTAASSDLAITGNNIANASTTGFKASRAEFSDVYASAMLGTATAASGTGIGVKVANISQQFDQGSISFTDNSLDLAIDGNGFFIASDNGAVTYTRAGAFGVDDGGYLVTSTGARVQGFPANSAGSLSGILGDLQVTIANLRPRPTSLVEVAVNLDAREAVLSSFGSRLTTTGAAVSTAQLGLPDDLPTVLRSSGPPAPFNFSVNTNTSVSAGNSLVPFNFSGAAASSFQVQLSGSSVPAENRTVTITLNSAINTLQDVISAIRDDLAGTGIGIDVRENPNVLGRLQFYALNAGENSVITIDPSDNATFGTGVTRTTLENVLGGISLGQGGAGSSSLTPNPYGGASTTGATGNKTSATFDVTLQNSSGNNGTATIVLNKNILSASDLITDIRDDLIAAGLSMDVREDPENAGRIQFYSTIPGEPSSITVTSINAANIGVTEADVVATLALETGVSIPGVPSASNGYAQQTVQVVYPDGTSIPVTIPAGSSASKIASIFSSPAIPQVSASATSSARIPASAFNNNSGTMQVTLNGVQLTGGNLGQLAVSINSGLPGIATSEAVIDTNGDLVITDRVGADLVFGITGDVTDSIDVIGNQGLAVTLDTSGDSVAVVGGTVSISLEEGVFMEDSFPAVTNIFGVLNEDAFEPFELNTFDPDNQNTYNAATSVKIFDSMGNAHLMSLFFVKQRFTPGVPGEEANRWLMYTQIDGQDVGDPDPNLPPPANIEPTRAAYEVRFNNDGSLQLGSTSLLVSNWMPVDSEGEPNGAMGPQNVLAGGALPILDPPGSSNFEIRLSDTTQFGSSFAVNSVAQDGNTTGELAGVSINDVGEVTARFSNGLSQTLGQVALAGFKNVQGLRAVGDTSWVETGDSGNPVVSAPGSGLLGLITAGALEGSNVELSEQLVNLIIAQRNFQANARTISTADEITQTIINL
ncbi:MAG: flagellar hook-basal body complex protein [Pseudomonadales bacterium]|nr:flagellar hook-basal body complex protein [Pseudomonadales bacterium]MCP5184726.1 flagellar hook-basal body complex protein [Pseudomonadales bacterium]